MGMLLLPRKFIASHRGIGAGGAHHENTIDSFKSVIRQGANVIELDVRKLADGELVLWHDNYLDDGKTPVANVTLEDLRVRCPHVVTLVQCAQELHGLVQLDVELKVPGIEAAVLQVFRQPDARWRRRDFVLTSFHESVFAAARALDPQVRTGLLIDHPPAFDDAFQRFFDLRTDFLAPNETSLTELELDRAADARVPLVPWPVNDPQRLEMFLRHESVAGVITDDVRGAVEVKRHL